MIDALLLLIVAILLFGAAAVRGLLSGVLGIVALIIVLVLAISVAQSIPPIVWWTMGGVLCVAITSLFVVVHREQAAAERKIAAVRLKGRLLAEEQQRERASAQEAKLEYERSRFHGNAPDRAKRRAIKRDLKLRAAVAKDSSSRKI